MSKFLDSLLMTEEDENTDTETVIDDTVEVTKENENMRIVDENYTKNKEPARSVRIMSDHEEIDGEYIIYIHPIVLTNMFCVILETRICRISCY